MARIDDEAASRELARAAECMEKAEELMSIAEVLREEAREHLREAGQLSPAIAAPLCNQP